MPIWIFIHNVLGWSHAVQGLCQFANLHNMRTLFIVGWLHLFELFWIYYLRNEKRNRGNHLDIRTHLDICNSVEPFSKYRIFSIVWHTCIWKNNLAWWFVMRPCCILKSTHWVLICTISMHLRVVDPSIIKISHLSYRYNTPV